MTKKIVLLGAALILASPFVVVAGAAGEAAEETAEQQVMAVPVGKYNEAPMLAALVAAGKLPPVDERLPTDPLVLTKERNEAPDGLLDFEVGSYGGTLHLLGHMGGRRGSPLFNPMAAEQLLFRPGYHLGDPLSPGVLDRWQANSDNTVFTFHIREGLKWSDGAPVTTRDVQFVYEDVFLEEQLIGGLQHGGYRFRSGSRADGAPYQLRVLDTHSYEVVFAEPTPQFLDLNNKPWNDYHRYMMPRHYLEQFHARYVSEAELMDQVKAVGLANKEDWPKMFWARAQRRGDATPEKIGGPVLRPWLLVSSTETRIEWERNPYYFKVDPAGNQLPYIDRVVSSKVEDPEAGNLKIISGEVDLDDHLPQISAIPLYKEHEERGGYQVALMSLPYNRITIFFNYAYENPVWREVVADVRFRRALAYSINNEEIADNVYQGFGEPAQWVPSEYSPAEANRLLDEVGLDQRDADGWRLGSDGKRFEIPFEIHARFPDRVPVTELVTEHFKAVGLYTTMKVLDQSLVRERGRANELRIIMDSDEATTLYSFGHARRWLGRATPTWRRWIDTAGAEGAKPPYDWWWTIFDLGMKMGPGIPWSDEVFNAYKSNIYEYVPFITVLHDPPQPVIINKNLGNIFTSGVSQWLTYSMEQMYFKE
jgi:peptide/nickel transport system substrate-binding protein